MLAEHTAADEELVPRGACIWAHQAAEKAIKALLVARDVDPPKLHDLDRLVGRLPEAVASVFDGLDLPELSPWAIEGRYPADLDGHKRRRDPCHRTGPFGDRGRANADRRLDAVTANLLRDDWKNLDSHELRLVLEERVAIAPPRGACRGLAAGPSLRAAEPDRGPPIGRSS
jgi:hypothetical protein